MDYPILTSRTGSFTTNLQEGWIEPDQELSDKLHYELSKIFHSRYPSDMQRFADMLNEWDETPMLSFLSDPSAYYNDIFEICFEKCIENLKEGETIEKAVLYSIK